MTDQLRTDLLRLTVSIVKAHLGRNQVRADALPELIGSVHRALSGLSTAPTGGTTKSDVRGPAVPVRKSVHPDYIVCLEDGARLVMLKRYLRTRFGLTPQAYRERWGLPANYPMVAPDYADRRSALAKRAGLGRKGREKLIDNSTVQPPEVEGEVAVTRLRARRARGANG